MTCPGPRLPGLFVAAVVILLIDPQAFAQEAVNESARQRLLMQSHDFGAGPLSAEIAKSDLEGRANGDVLTQTLLKLFAAHSGLVSTQTVLNVSVQSGGANHVNVSPGATVEYDVVGILGDNNNQGLALVGFDLHYTASPLAQADTPSGNPNSGCENPMIHFTIPWGITNPAGYGGTIINGDLIQVGGGQNTINNTPNNAPFPIGSVLLGVAKPSQAPLGCGTTVLAHGTLVAPFVGGDNTLILRNLFANVIDANTTGTPFWVTHAAGTGTITNLTIAVTDGVAACCGVYEVPDPNNPANTVFQSGCENLTEDQCNSQHPNPLMCLGGSRDGLGCQTSTDCPGGGNCDSIYPNGAPSLWQPGQVCGQDGQACPLTACLQRSGLCNTPHSTAGCKDAFCCDCVCSSFGEIGAYCCEVEWDDTCVLISISPCGEATGACVTRPSDCDDGVACTTDTFDPFFPSCQHTPSNALCDDGIFCNGMESCDAIMGCQPGALPSCDDGVACTVDTCNEAARGCDHTPSDALCDDGDRCTSDSCTPTGCAHQNICGSCCNQRDGACTDAALASNCTCSQCVWTAGGSCSANQCQPQFIPIPTVSTWGTAIIGLILLIGLKIRFGGRRESRSRDLFRSL